MTHTLKICPSFYDEVLAGIKTFELRKNDRGFKVGDFLRLREYFGKYTDRECKVKITYVLQGAEADQFGLRPGYCVLSIKVVK